MIRSRTAVRGTSLGVGAALFGVAARGVVARGVAAFGVAAFGVLASAGPAAAHVTVNPDEATQGGYARVAFRVPNESDSASTTKVEVFLPQDAPIASVSTMTVPGWSVAVTKAKSAKPVPAENANVSEVVTKLTWTASSAAAIEVGEFQEFPVSLGPLPATDKLIFKALQTYSDGNVVRWIDEPAAAGAGEPQSPAPVLTLAKVAPGSAAPEAVATAPVGNAIAKGTEADKANGGERTNGAADQDGTDGIGVGLGVAGLVAGLGGLLLGGLAFIRTRKRPAASTG